MDSGWVGAGWGVGGRDRVEQRSDCDEVPARFPRPAPQTACVCPWKDVTDLDLFKPTNPQACGNS